MPIIFLPFMSFQLIYGIFDFLRYILGMELEISIDNSLIYTLAEYSQIDLQRILLFLLLFSQKTYTIPNAEL
jgi:hypothetical protein